MASNALEVLFNMAFGLGSTTLLVRLAETLLKSDSTMDADAVLILRNISTFKPERKSPTQEKEYKEFPATPALLAKKYKVGFRI